jgi:hypothetical protein
LGSLVEDQELQVSRIPGVSLDPAEMDVGERVGAGIGRKLMAGMRRGHGQDTHAGGPSRLNPGRSILYNKTVGW